VAAVRGNANAGTDAGIGAILAEAAVQGGALTVAINLGSIDDQAYVQAARAELDTILKESADLRAEVLRITYDTI